MDEIKINQQEVGEPKPAPQPTRPQLSPELQALLEDSWVRHRIGYEILKNR